MNIFANLLSDDDDTNIITTTLDATTRHLLSNDISQLLDVWNVGETVLTDSTDTTFAIRTLKPLFRLIESKSTVSQYFALWTIANLTTTQQGFIL